MRSGYALRPIPGLRPGVMRWRRAGPRQRSGVQVAARLDYFTFQRMILITVPMRLRYGTLPQARESHDELRLSPITK
jgi:hypothetical protein